MRNKLTVLQAMINESYSVNLSPVFGQANTPQGCAMSHYVALCDLADRRLAGFEVEVPKFPRYNGSR